MTSLFTLVPYYCFGTFQKNKLTGYSSLIIRANPNHTAAHIVISGLLIALPKMCILHWREICSLQVLSLHSLLEGFRTESLLCIDSLNHSLKPNARKKWTFIKAHTNHTAAPIVKSGSVIVFLKMNTVEIHNSRKNGCSKVRHFCKICKNAWL